MMRYDMPTEIIIYMIIMIYKGNKVYIVIKHSWEMIYPYLVHKFDIVYNIYGSNIYNLFA